MAFLDEPKIIDSPIEIQEKRKIMSVPAVNMKVSIAKAIFVPYPSV
jgi:hypothetical protein